MQNQAIRWVQRLDSFSRALVQLDRSARSWREFVNFGLPESVIENPALIDHIDRVGMLLYARSPVDET